MRTLLLLSMLTLAGCSLLEPGAPPEPPPGPPEPSFPPARAIHVPGGFDAQVYARGLRNPTALAWGPDGRLYATQNGGQVVVVQPNDRRPRVYARGFTVPLGLTWFRGHLYVSGSGTLYRDGKPIVTGLPYGLHQQDNVVPGPDGRLYLGSGSTCNACVEKDGRSAAILSVRPDGSDLRVEATGLRNPYGLVWHRGELYVSVNGRDDLGEWNPAESVVRLRRGADYGWPDCWPDWRTRRLAGNCAGVARPLAYLEPHSSADGIAVWRGKLYVAEWGQYNADLHGRRVVRVDLATGRVRRFADGFPHPLALAVDPWGGLLIADYETGVIYRVRKR
jgi:glucose/arabinose dehydrogenase